MGVLVILFAGSRRTAGTQCSEGSAYLQDGHANFALGRCMRVGGGGGDRVGGARG